VTQSGAQIRPRFDLLGGVENVDRSRKIRVSCNHCAYCGLFSDEEELRHIREREGTGNCYCGTPVATHRIDRDSGTGPAHQACAG